MDSRGRRTQRRQEENRSRRLTNRHRLDLDYPKEIYIRLAQTARQHGVSVRVWLRALTLESTGIRPMLTQEPPEVIKRIVEERFE